MATEAPIENIFYPVWGDVGGRTGVVSYVDAYGTPYAEIPSGYSATVGTDTNGGTMWMLTKGDNTTIPTSGQLYSNDFFGGYGSSEAQRTWTDPSVTGLYSGINAATGQPYKPGEAGYGSYTDRAQIGGQQEAARQAASDSDGLGLLGSILPAAALLIPGVGPALTAALGTVGTGALVGGVGGLLSTGDLESALKGAALGGIGGAITGGMTGGDLFGGGAGVADTGYIDALGGMTDATGTALPGWSDIAQTFPVTDYGAGITSTTLPDSSYVDTLGDWPTAPATTPAPVVGPSAPSNLAPGNVMDQVVQSGTTLAPSTATPAMSSVGGDPNWWSNFVGGLGLPDTASSALTKLGTAIGNDPIRAATLGLGAYQYFDQKKKMEEAKAQEEADTAAYMNRPINQDIVNKYGKVPALTPIQYQPLNYQGFQSVGLPQGLLEQRLGRMQYGLMG